MSVHKLEPHPMFSVSRGPAMLHQHPSAPVKFDAPAYGFDPVPESEMAVLDAGEAIVRLAAKVGSYARLDSILHTYAAIAGEKL